MATATRQRSRKGSKSDLAVIGAVIAAVVFVAGIVGVLVTSGGDGGGSTAVGGSGEQAAAAESDTVTLQPTGETNDMGLPVYETPGFASGSAEAGGIAVQGSDWAMGRVPLGIAVRPFWTLTNTGQTPVTLGEPQAEVREGCCPGPFALGASTLEPGESTVLTFELSMHEGMDGWHDMGVYVPVQGAGGKSMLELNVTGDFRN
jgi:hypothetical protein